MSDKKISQLDSASPLDGTEVLPLVQNGTTVKATLDDVLGLVPPIAWGNITGTITDQTDLISYLGSNYVPSTREITINGTTYDLSADRSWTIATATETLAQTLAAGNTSGSYDILMNTAQRVGFKDGDNTYTTYLSNNQSQAANRTVYLPVYNGTLTYKTTNLTSNYILKGTTNEAIVSSSLIYDNGTNVGIGTSSPSYKLQVNTSGINVQEIVVLTATNSQSMLAFGLNNVADGRGLQLVYQGSTSAYTSYGVASSGSLYQGVGVVGFNFMSSDGGFWRFFQGPATTQSIMSIDGSGVSIGRNTIDDAALHIKSRTFFNYALKLDDTSNNQIFYVHKTAGVGIKGSTSDSSAYALKVDNSSSSPLLYVRNDGFVGIGTSSPSYILDVQKSANAFTNLFYGTNSNASSSSAALITVKSDVAALDIGVLGSATSGFSNYGNAKGVFLRGDASSTSFHVLYQTKYVLAVDGYTSTPTFKADGGYAAFNVPLATSISGTILTVRGETSDNSGYALKVQNSSSSALLYVRNDGVVLMNNLPTSSAGLPSGALWNNSGVINIV